jgi:hypothetical protein
MFKFWHLVALVAIIFACIWASNNIAVIGNVVK